MQSVDHSFEPAAFLDGAEKAFRIIVTAFAAGDRTTLQGLLSADTWRAFEQAITLREAGGQTQVSTIHAVHSATIENAELGGQVASITVRFVSRSDQHHAGQGWQSSHRHGRGDRDHRPLDFRAEPLDARSGVAVGLGGQCLMQGCSR